MQPPRMVHLTDVSSEFTARVMVAKLGSAGIVAEVRGVGGPYPTLAEPGVFVEEAELVDARELIAAGADDGFAVDPRDLERPVEPVSTHRRPLARAVIVTTALLLLGSFTFGPRCSPAPITKSR